MTDQKKRQMKKMKDTIIKSDSIESVYSGVKEILAKARSTTYRAVNFAMVQAYWNIGRVIVEDDQKGKRKTDYGRKLIQGLSKRLTVDFGRRFTISNLKYMRQFYLAFPIGHAVSGQSFPISICQRKKNLKMNWRKKEG
jgi:predicted GNAT family N-acyltransferase